MSAHQVTILFDAHPLLNQKTGIGYYTEQLVRAMSANYPQEIRLVGYYHNFLLRKHVSNLPAADNISYRQIALVPGQAVNLLRRHHIDLPIELLTLTKPDFILYPNFWGPPSLFRIPFAPVVHDLTFIDHPQYGSQKNMQDLQQYMPAVIRKSSFVVTVSDFSKARIVDQFKTKPAKVLVTHIPPGSPLKINREKSHSILSKQGISKPYLLFIGTLEPRKNLATLIDAYTSLPQKIRDGFSLVIAGKMDWKYEETANKIKRAQKEGNDIKYLGYVDDSTRATLYENARLFILPSYYEGFGMQILEAFSYGIPCVVSDIPVFREIASDLAQYFDPRSADSMASAIETQLKHTQDTQKDAMQSYLSKNFVWDKICETLYTKIREVTHE